MNPNPLVPAGPTLRRSFRPLLALFAPKRWLEEAVNADYLAELDQNVQLQGAGEEVRHHYLEALRDQARSRLSRFRRSVAITIASLTSAALAAIGFRLFYGGPMLPRSVYGVGSSLLFVSATLGLLKWRGRLERFGPRLFQVLYWIAVCWGVLALW